MIISQIRCLSQPGPSSTQGTVFQMMCNFPMQGARYGCRLIGSLCCNSPTGSCHRHHTASFSIADTSSIIGSVRQCGPRGRITCIATYGRSLFCSGPHSKLEVICVNLLEQCFQYEICCLQSLKRPTNHCACLRVGELLNTFLL